MTSAFSVQFRTAFLLFLAAALFFSCTEEQASAPPLQKVKQELSSEMLWLADTKNYLEADYKAFFGSYFQAALSKQQYDSAAHALALYTRQLEQNSLLTEEDKHFALDFLEREQAHIPAHYRSTILLNLGHYHFNNSQLEQAQAFFEQATELPEERSYSIYKALGEAYYSLAFVHFYSERQDESLLMNKKASWYFSQIDNPLSHSLVLDLSGRIYSYLEQYEQAELAYDSLLAINKEHGDLGNKLIAYSYVINLAEKTRDSIKQKKIIRELYSIWQAEREHIPSTIKLYLLSFIVRQLIDQEELAKAKEELDALKPILDEPGMSIYKSYYAEAFALYEEASGEESDLYEDYALMLPELEADDKKHILAVLYTLLKRKKFAEGDYQLAYRYKEKEDSIGRILETENTKYRVLELEKKYQTEAKTQLLLLRGLQLKQSQERVILLSLALAALALAFFSYLLWQRQVKLKQKEKQRQQFTEQLLQKSEEERKRIAQDLHDSINQELYLLKHTNLQNPEELHRQADKIIEQVRVISRNLHPVLFEQLGLVASLESFVERLQEQETCFVHAELDYSGGLSTEKELQIYRIAQEALRNSLKYAEAQACKLSLEEQAEDLILCIQDNGKGFAVEKTLQSGKAFGLHNISTRAAILGAKLRIDSEEQKGTKISLQIPKC